MFLYPVSVWEVNLCDRWMAGVSSCFTAFLGKKTCISQMMTGCNRRYSSAFPSMAFLYSISFFFIVHWFILHLTFYDFPFTLILSVRWYCEVATEPEHKSNLVPDADNATINCNNDRHNNNSNNRFCSIPNNKSLGLFELNYAITLGARR